jgi:hypothetical protein
VAAGWDPGGTVNYTGTLSDVGRVEPPWVWDE